MTQIPPQQPRPLELNYQTRDPYGNGPTLVKLVGIFNFVSAGVDLLMCAFLIGMLVFMFKMAPLAPATLPHGATHKSAAPDMLVFSIIYGGGAGLAILAGAAKCVGATLLLKHKRTAWAWGIAIGCVGLGSVWALVTCCVFYFVPLAVGTFTIVIMCLPHVREYLRLPVAQVG